VPKEGKRGWQAVRDIAAGTMLVHACRWWFRWEGSANG
jgi:hypothetical protein